MVTLALELGREATPASAEIEEIAAEARSPLRVFLNGEMVLELARAAGLGAVGAASSAPSAADGQLHAARAADGARRESGFAAAVQPNGPFALSPEARISLFGDYDRCSIGGEGSGEGGGCSLLKHVKALTLAPRPASLCDVRVEHTYGVWRCQQAACADAAQGGVGFRNGPDATYCGSCNATRP